MGVGGDRASKRAAVSNMGVDSESRFIGDTKKKTSSFSSSVEMQRRSGEPAKNP
jgi:hypothetical protein